MELALCHPSGTWNFKVAPTFLDTSCTSHMIHSANFLYFIQHSISTSPIFRGVFKVDQC